MEKKILDILVMEEIIFMKKLKKMLLLFGLLEMIGVIKINIKFMVLCNLMLFILEILI